MMQAILAHEPHEPTADLMAPVLVTGTSARRSLSLKKMPGAGACNGCVPNCGHAAHAIKRHGRIPCMRWSSCQRVGLWVVLDLFRDKNCSGMDDPDQYLSIGERMS